MEAAADTPVAGGDPGRSDAGFRGGRPPLGRKATALGTLIVLVGFSTAADLVSHGAQAAVHHRATTTTVTLADTPTTVAAQLEAAAAELSPTATTTAPPPPPATTTTVSRSTVAGPGTTQMLELPSGDADHKARAVWVYRPDVPDSSTLPVVYFLHGYPGTATDLAGTGAPALLDAAFRAGAAPFVVAAPDGNSTIHPDTEWADSADGTVRVESFVTTTAIAAVEGAHPRDRAHRAIAGFSMGGYGAMNVGLRHPGLFGQIVSIAGYFHTDDLSGMGAGNPAWARANSPDQHIAAGTGERILLIADAGESDPLIAGQAVLFKNLADADGLDPTYSVVPGDHSWAMVAGAMPGVVSFLDANW